MCFHKRISTAVTACITRLSLTHYQLLSLDVKKHTHREPGEPKHSVRIQRRATPTDTMNTHDAGQTSRLCVMWRHKSTQLPVTYKGDGERTSLSFVSHEGPLIFRFHSSVSAHPQSTRYYPQWRRKTQSRVQVRQVGNTVV